MNKIWSFFLFVGNVPTFISGSEIERQGSTAMICTEDWGKASGSHSHPKRLEFPIIDFSKFDTQSSLCCEACCDVIKAIISPENFSYDTAHLGQIIEKKLTNKDLSIDEKRTQTLKILEEFKPIIDKGADIEKFGTQNLFIKIQFGGNRQSIESVISSNFDALISDREDDSITLKVNCKKISENIAMLAQCLANIPTTIIKWCKQGYINKGGKLTHVINPHAESIVIDNTINELADSAFSNCTDLQKVQFEKDSQLKIIGNFVFSGCKALTEIEIPSTVAALGKGVFSGCSSLSKVILRNHMTEIPENMFSGCSALLTFIVDFNQGIQKIGNNAFANCENLTRILFPNAVVVGDKAFLGCKKLFDITLSGSMSSIGSYALSETKISRINLGQISEIPERLFKNCLALKKVTIPNTVSSINDEAFYGCSSLSNLDIPNSVKSLGNRVFQKSGLTGFNLNQISEMGEEVFRECTSLIKVCGKVLQKIGAHAFYKCVNLKEAIFQNVNTIEGAAFAKCSNLEHVAHNEESLYSVDLSKVTNISGSVFYKCPRLVTVNLPAVLTVSPRCFEECTQLQRVLVTNATKIDMFSFYKCFNLQHVNMNNVEMLGRGAFMQCSSLKEINGPKVKNIGDKCFKCCLELTKVNLPMLETTGVYAFGGCSSLTSFIIPLNLKEISYGMFYQCEKLVEIDLGNVQKIGSKAFSNCSSLRNTVNPQTKKFLQKIFEFPKSVISIERYAFANCPYLKNIAFLNQDTKLQINSFDSSVAIDDLSQRTLDPQENRHDNDTNYEWEDKA